MKTVANAFVLILFLASHHLWGAPARRDSGSTYDSLIFHEQVIATQLSLLDQKARIKDAKIAEVEARLHKERMEDLHKRKAVSDEEFELAVSAFAVASTETKIAHTTRAEIELSSQIAEAQHNHVLGQEDDLPAVKKLYDARWDTRSEIAHLELQRCQEELVYLDKRLARMKKLEGEKFETKEAFQKLKAQRYATLHRSELAKDKIELLTGGPTR